MRSHRVFFILSPVLLVLAVFSVGCGDGGGGPKFTDRESGLSMRLPEGWHAEGKRFFGTRDLDIPSGVVFVMEREGADLESHANTAMGNLVKMSEGMSSMVGLLGKLTGGEIQKEADEARKVLKTDLDGPRPVTIGGLAAFEAVIKKPDITSYIVFLDKGASVVEVTFTAETARWSEFEPLFRAAAQTIKLK